MLRIEFEYHDSFSPSEKWSKQTCVCRSIEECKKFYGLGIDPDCEYKIIKVEEV